MTPFQETAKEVLEAVRLFAEVSPAVSNTSPLIVLAKADLLGLLPKLFSEVIVPAAVRD